MKKTQEQCQADPLMAILNGYQEFIKIGEWREEMRGGRDSGFILQLVHPWSPAQFAQVSCSFLDEENEAPRLMRGEPTWLRFEEIDLRERI